ncbi:hypothetical protein Tco_0861013 [Tanacetum coccineum]|uniref:Reverse transcriptase Ty1/copia-type domain-containing protein n=1 Tax=Tanacetum coccineum TaxID=301880 RepID=A0ABQ5BGJ7_9ASTR
MMCLLPCSMSTPMATERLDADLQGTPTDQTTYHRMIGGLMYLTASRPDIAFATFVCTRYQARSIIKHLKEVKRIFWYLRQSYNMGLWYLKDSGFELITYSDADHAGCKDDCKSTSGGLQFLGGKLLLWKGLYYSLHHPTSSIPNPRFTKIIIIHYMTSFPEISRRARDMYHNLQDDDIMKNIFNSGRHKDKVGMQIPNWMITEEMKHTEQYMMYAEVFGLNVPLTQPQPTESTQGTHRTPSVPRSPNPKMDAAESSAPKRSTMIHFRLPKKRSTRLTPPAPVPTIDKADEIILKDSLQVSLAEHKSREEQEARENVELVNNHLASKEIEKMLISDKESPEVEITNDEEVEITNAVIPVNVNEKKEEITDKVYELKRREKGKIVEECDNHDLSIFGNQSIERDRLIGLDLCWILWSSFRLLLVTRK